MLEHQCNVNDARQEEGGHCVGRLNEMKKGTHERFDSLSYRLMQHCTIMRHCLGVAGRI